MMENVDRLPDAFWSKDEMHQMVVDVLEPNRFNQEPAHIVLYHLYKNGADTGLVLITVVESVLDGQDAINMLWADVGITAVVGEYSDESTMSHVKVDAMYMVLQKYKYVGKLKLVGHQKVFKYQEWFNNLVQS
jgi:hypothetical protein